MENKNYWELTDAEIIKEFKLKEQDIKDIKFNLKLFTKDNKKKITNGK